MNKLKPRLIPLDIVDVTITQRQLLGITVRLFIKYRNISFPLFRPCVKLACFARMSNIFKIVRVAQLVERMSFNLRVVVYTQTCHL